jgi:hypothetical protein
MAGHIANTFVHIHILSRVCYCRQLQPSRHVPPTTFAKWDLPCHVNPKGQWHCRWPGLRVARQQASVANATLTQSINQSQNTTLAFIACLRSASDMLKSTLYKKLCGRKENSPHTKKIQLSEPCYARPSSTWKALLPTWQELTRWGDMLGPARGLIRYISPLMTVAAWHLVCSIGPGLRVLRGGLKFTGNFMGQARGTPMIPNI